MIPTIHTVGKESFQALNHRYLDLLAKRRPLIVVHRGSPGGVIVENTTKAAKSALQQGADIVEIDVIRSSDGEFFVFHNGYEKMHFNLDADIRDLCAQEISELAYLWFDANPEAPSQVEKLSDLLNAFPDAIINIDRSWEYWDTLLPYLDTFDAADRLLLKSPAQQDYFRQLSEHSTKYPYMPIVKSTEELELALSYGDLNLIAVEILAEHPQDALAQPELIDKLHSEGVLMHLNALNLANRKPLFLGWDDETSVLENPHHGWGRLIDHGADLIQTDFPALLASYISQRA